MLLGEGFLSYMILENNCRNMSYSAYPIPPATCIMDYMVVSIFMVTEKVTKLMPLEGNKCNVLMEWLVAVNDINQLRGLLRYARHGKIGIRKVVIVVEGKKEIIGGLASSYGLRITRADALKILL